MTVSGVAQPSLVVISVPRPACGKNVRWGAFGRLYKHPPLRRASLTRNPCADARIPTSPAKSGEVTERTVQAWRPFGHPQNHLR